MRCGRPGDPRGLRIGVYAAQGFAACWVEPQTVAAIEVRSLTKRFGTRRRGRRRLLRRRAGQGDRLPRPQRRGQDDDPAHGARPRAADQRQRRRSRAAATRGLADPAGTVGAALEHSGFHPGRRGRDHLRVIARAAGIAESRADEVLAAGGARRRGQAPRRRLLARHAPAPGARHRAARRSARSSCSTSRPTASIPQGIRWLRDFLRWYAAEGRTVLVSSHVLAEVAQTADAAIVIAKGRVVAQGIDRGADGGPQGRRRGRSARARAARRRAARRAASP